ncbi:Ig-like domain-containing protein [Embleya sp. NBC_00888]|uniref:L,D-transpeptidase n=1 Tax=Embleya sp. NBC_00888 TaxID=2975960 RepID=UPI00386B6CA3|nr:Ig-like domain-containing protein [Embleya sp. NBC_00888]
MSRIIRRTGVAALVAASLLLTGACNKDDAKKTTPDPAKAAGENRAGPAEPAVVTLTPADKATGVDPGAPVTIAVGGGKVAEVKVTNASGESVDGALAGNAWKPKVPFMYGGKYTVTATATNADNKPTTATSAFTVLNPTRPATATFMPDADSTVGVGQPVSITFDEPVKNHKAVQEAIKVTPTPAVDGAWHWFGNSRVEWRPKDYWQVGTQVKVDLNLRGVDLGGGVMSKQFKSFSFKISDTKRIAVVDANAHTMTVSENDQVVKTIPITAGEDPKYTTWNGIMVMEERYPTLDMNSQTVGLGNEYDQKAVPFAMRITESGTFLHANTWATTNPFGNANTSHGCVSMALENAKWFYERSIRGDIVQVKGNEEKPVAADNGYGAWNLTWEQWTAGN